MDFRVLGFAHPNLLSVSKLISRGLKVHFNSLECVVRANNNDILGVASLESNLYPLDTNVVNGAEMSFLAHSDGNLHSLKLWHKRLGHLNTNSMKMLRNIVSGMDMGAAQGDIHSFACERCVGANKQGDIPHGQRHSRHQDLEVCAFRRMRADENVVHRRRKVFSHLH